jgi:hypothetical protein
LSVSITAAISRICSADAIAVKGGCEKKSNRARNHKLRYHESLNSPFLLSHNATVV